MPTSTDEVLTETMEIDQVGVSGNEPNFPSFFINSSTAHDSASEMSLADLLISAHDSTDIEMPDCPPPAPKAQSPSDFLGPKVVPDTFPALGQTYLLRVPTTGCILGHTKRRFFLISSSHNPEESPHISWKWTFEDIAGDETMIRLKSPWLEDNGTRWILLDVKLNPDGKVVVSVDWEMRRDPVLDKIKFKETCLSKGGKRLGDDQVGLVAEVKRGCLAFEKRGEAIGWEFIRVPGP